MVSFRSFALVASTIVGLASTAPTDLTARQTFTPGTLNNTQEFYITLEVTNGPLLTKYNGWQIETYHTGAGLADPVFAASGSPAYLNGTQLQFDVNLYPFSLNALPSDTNYARWEPTYITSGYGSGVFVDAGAEGIVVDDPEFGGWLVCEWFHGVNAPQLFQLIEGFDSPDGIYPATCAKVLLLPKYF